MAAKTESKAAEQPRQSEQKPEGKIEAGNKSRAGFKATGQAHPGVDPETGERRAVTLEGLKAEFGRAKGARLYNEIALASGAGGQADGYSPDISLVPGARTNKEQHQAVLDLIAQAESDKE